VTDIARRAALASAVGLLTAAAVVAVATAPGTGSNSGAGVAATHGWLPLASSPLARTEVAAARIGKHIFVVGGFDQSGRTLSDVARYNIARDAWTQVRSMPVGVDHPTATSHRGKLYVHGGFTDAGATSALQRYDPKEDQWKRLPDSDTPRAAHALGEIDGKLYAAGGANSSSDRLTSLEIYNVAKRTWRSGPRMRVGRNHVAGAVAGGRLYVLGGRPGNLDVAEAYDPRRGRWSDVAPLDTPRSGFAAVAVEGKIVAFGGEEGAGTIAAVELYHPRADRWTALPDMRSPRHGLGGASRGRRVFALEGGPQPALTTSSALEFLDVPKRSAK
jgi:N-acetylneuraminic acid mutarotase